MMDSQFARPTELADEQRGIVQNGSQREGTGRFFRSRALHFAYVRQVDCAQCTLTCENWPPVRLFKLRYQALVHE